MAEALVQVLVDKLSSLIMEEIGSFMGAEADMKKLSMALITIQAVLEDAQDKQLESKAIRNWLRNLNDLAYEIDDVLDECATEASKLQNQNGIFNFRILKKILNRFKIWSRMREVTDSLNALAAESHKFGLQTWDKERQSKSAPTRETGSVIIEPDLVYGRDKDMEKIINILVNHVKDSQHLSILPIIGIGGLGKTTLAQLVYNYLIVTQHFEKKVWVCVSDNFDTKTLVKAMIESATGNRSASDHLDTLQCRLRELLNQKKYLLILDDVWNEDQEEWAKLKSVLACGSRGASIVVTTRLKKVADIMGTHPAHHLSGLLEEHCWSLFRQRAFGQEMGKHPKLEAIGKEIVKKCAGVPLAAKALGGLLRFKREEKEWFYVKESEIWNLPHEEALILPSLRLSYQHLPLHFRQCFAYCSIYPKDYKMEKEEVIYCWMAHGYISSKERMDVEDVGDDVWNQLVLRSLFQDVGRSYKGKITFKMHDLVHDLAQSIMENKVPGGKVDSSDRSAINRNKIRQVNVLKHYVAFPGNYHNEVNVPYIFKNFDRLRVLDASGTDMKDLPSAIDRLKHLRCLNLSESPSLHTLSDELCSLWNLQTLNLNKCNNLVKLPKRMRYMKNLRHILLDGCDSLSEMPPKIGQLTSLKTLTMFIVSQKKGNQLDELQNLNLGGRLEIKHLERVKNHFDAKKANIGKKPNIRQLVLRWKGDNASEQQRQMDEKVLEALEPHSNLDFLEISGFKGGYFPHWTGMGNLTHFLATNFPNCSSLPPLGDLPRLKLVYLRNLTSLEYVMENEVDGGDQVNDAILFPALEQLHLQFLPNLKGLLKHEKAEEVGIIFPNLQNLLIGGFSPMLKLPPLSSLKKLKCNNLNLNSLSIFGNLTYLSVGFDNDTTCITKECLEKLSKLKTLVLTKASEHNLPIEEGLQSLKSLVELDIHNCDRLTSLPNVWLRHLTALEKLSMRNCKELVELMKYPLHSSLKHLKLTHLPKMACLPEVLQYMIPSLQSITLFGLPQLTLLPSWLGNFTSVQHLDIHSCPQLTSLPASIQGMTNLKKLSIHQCPKLERRCEKEKGEDWDIIAHIPDLNIGGV